jgi:hypothetical protein
MSDLSICFDAFLCRAWGETDLPSAELATDWEGVQRFLIREWIGEEDATDYEGTPTLPGVKESFEEHEKDMGTNGGPFSIEFEIGGVSIERVCGFAAAATEVVAWRYKTPTGWHATTDAAAAMRVRTHHPVEPLYASPPAAPATGKEKAGAVAEIPRGALPTLRNVIATLRENGRFEDEEGEPTDALEDLCEWLGALAAPAAAIDAREQETDDSDDLTMAQIETIDARGPLIEGWRVEHENGRNGWGVYAYYGQIHCEEDCFFLLSVPEPASREEAPAATGAALATSDGSTPGVWFVRKRERDGELLDCFIAAPDCNGFAFDAEILGDDEYREDTGMARKLADCELVCKLVNAHRAAPASTPEGETASSEAVQPRQYLLSADYIDLHRFIETTEDDESFDIGKQAVQRLAELGVVRSCGFGRYSVTAFGYWAHEHHWRQNPALPLLLNSDRDANARAALRSSQPVERSSGVAS